MILNDEILESIPLKSGTIQWWLLCITCSMSEQLHLEKKYKDGKGKAKLLFVDNMVFWETLKQVL